MHNIRRYILALLLCGTSFGAEVAAQVLADTHALTLQGIKVIAAAAEAEAVENDWNVVIAIVDAGGHLLFLERMDDVLLASLEVAQQKARTAVQYRRPTKAFADRLSSGNLSTLELPGVIALEGGLPIIVDGRVIGAVGVSGVQADQDAQIARAGIEALLDVVGQ